MECWNKVALYPLWNELWWPAWVIITWETFTVTQMHWLLNHWACLLMIHICWMTLYTCLEGRQKQQMTLTFLLELLRLCKRALCAWNPSNSHMNGWHSGARQSHTYYNHMRKRSMLTTRSHSFWLILYLVVTQLYKVPLVVNELDLFRTNKPTKTEDTELLNKYKYMSFWACHLVPTQRF